MEDFNYADYILNEQKRMPVDEALESLMKNASSSDAAYGPKPPNIVLKLLGKKLNRDPRYVKAVADDVGDNLAYGIEDMIDDKKYDAWVTFMKEREKKINDLESELSFREMVKSPKEIKVPEQPITPEWYTNVMPTSRHNR